MYRLRLEQVLLRLLRKIGLRGLELVPFPQVLGLAMSLLPDRLVTLYSPVMAAIETTNYCNLKCPLCPYSIMTREKGMMKLQEFKQIVDQLPRSVKKLSPLFVGEPLLNKDICRIIRYASDRGIETWLSTNTTILNLDILDCGLTDLTISLDGASKVTHEMIKAGSDFDMTVDNIKRFCEHKKKINSKTTISVQCLVTRQNEHEIAKVIEMSRKLGADHLVLRKVNLGPFRFTDDLTKEIMAAKYLPENRKYRLLGQLTSDPKLRGRLICYWPWASQILWNGDVTICCVDYDGHYVIGNVFRDGGFLKIYRSRKYKELRRRMLTGRLELCQKCSPNIGTGIQVY